MPESSSHLTSSFRYSKDAPILHRSRHTHFKGTSASLACDALHKPPVIRLRQRSHVQCSLPSRDISETATIFGERASHGLGCNFSWKKTRHISALPSKTSSLSPFIHTHTRTDRNTSTYGTERGGVQVPQKLDPGMA